MAPEVLKHALHGILKPGRPTWKVSGLGFRIQEGLMGDLESSYSWKRKWKLLDNLGFKV